MRRRSDAAQALQWALEELPFVANARASHITATVLVVLRPGTSESTLEQAISRLLRAPLTLERVRPRPRPSEPGAGPTGAATPDTRGAGVALPPFHSLPPDQVIVLCESARDGLAAAQAAERLRRDGPNALVPPPRRSELRIFVDQLTGIPVAMLGVSAVLSAATGGVADAVAIMGVLGLNAAIGYATESGAERTIASLTKSPDQAARVLRDGEVRSVRFDDVVRGDVLLLAAGAFVPADGRLLDAEDLTVDESSLTGESVPVLKQALDVVDAITPLAERLNMVYRGTLVTGGSGRAVVVAVGTRTEVGQIQALATGVEQRDTPLQQQLDHLGTQLAIGAGVACAATMGLGMLRGQALLPMFRTAVSLGVAAVPEGLPTVAITALALGLSRMRDERVVVRQLTAVETLGSVQVVCLDKTGTLTENRMTVVALQAGLERYAVRAGKIVDASERAHDAVGSPDLTQLLKVAMLCSEVEIGEERGVSVLTGSPTESAIVQVAIDVGLAVVSLRAQHPLLEMHRRAERRNYMSTVHDTADGRMLAVKGRPSEVLAMCTHYLCEGQRLPLGDAERAAIENDNEHMAGRALRVLGAAYLHCDPGWTYANGASYPLVWAGLIGMEDPPRANVAQVMASFHRAGIRTVMITGDQSATAHAVGKRVGLSENDHLEIIDSTRLDRVDSTLLASLAQRAHVFSRVSPAHKLQIVQALQEAGFVVAMTGDGINDGPALKAADIGIAMGAGSTVVAREMADVVLEDDQLTTLVLAIEQGRTIYDDIRKAVHFILATNLSEILYTFVGVASGMGEPLTTMQLLWINLLTDVFPELALALQPPESDVLARPPRDPARAMFVEEDLWHIAGEGAILTAGALTAYLWAVGRSGPGPRASTVGFTALTLAQLLHAFSARSEHHTIFDREHLGRNPWLVTAISGTLLMQALASFVPGLRRLLGTVPLTPVEWAVSLLAAGAPFLANETVKLSRRPASPASPPVALALPPTPSE